MVRETKDSQQSTFTNTWFKIMQKKHVLTRAIGIQNENWEEPRIFQKFQFGKNALHIVTLLFILKYFRTNLLL